ncbi:MAG TPA: LytTR family DNA-binding domain-containing protein [Prosthecobacter sp.]
MKALIVDDERLARQELRLLLSTHEQVRVVGEADTVESAVANVQELAPDVVFLDVQLRGGTGFELIERLQDRTPLIVFCTAYQQHAVSAFDSEAVDYLLKPVAPARLARTVAKLGAVLEGPAEIVTPDAAPPLETGSRVLLREGERHAFVPVADIVMLVSEGNYCRVHLDGTGAEPFLLYRSLQSLVQRLPGAVFFRASRSVLINISHIASLQPWFSQSLKARLSTGAEVEFSRRAAQAFRDRHSL